MLRPGPAVLAALLLLAPLPVAGQGGQPEIVDLAFEGNAAFPEDSLRRAIVNRQTECRTFLFRWVLPFCPLGFDFADDEHYLQPRELPRDAVRLRIFYYQRGFREAVVDTAVTATGEEEVRVRFLVQEGRPVLVDSVALTWDEGLQDTTLVQDLPLRPGDHLSAFRLDAVRDTLIRRLRSQGYAHADVFRSFFIPTDDPYAARVTFDVAPGTRARFGPITIVGDGPAGELEELSETVIRRMLPFQEGDLYDQAEIFEAQRNLYSLEIVSSARIEEDLTQDPDSVVPLSVRVSESTEYRVRAGAGLSEAECLNSEARWVSRNFLGGARRLQLRGRVSNVLASGLNSSLCTEAGDSIYARLNWLASVDFNQPWIFSPRNSLSASVFAERQSLAQIFVREAVGVTAGLTRSIGSRSALTVGYRPQVSWLDAAEVFFCVSFLVCDPTDVAVLQAANWLAPVGASATRDRTDDVLSPSRGYAAFLDLEHAGTWALSDYTYERAIGELRGYRPLGQGGVLGGRIRAGWVGSAEFGELERGGLEVIHPQKRFYAGGANSVRGFPQNRLGPRILTIPVESLLLPRQDGASHPPCSPAEIVARTCDAGTLDDDLFSPNPTGGNRVVEGNVEYRFEVGRPQLQGALFLDFGQVWGERDDFDPGDVEWAPGTGIRYFSPVGPIRVDVAYRFRAGEPLRVVTSQIQPAAGGDLCVPDEQGGETCFQKIDELALLGPRVLYGEDPAGASRLDKVFRRLQLHLSIGQAF